MLDSKTCRFAFKRRGFNCRHDLFPPLMIWTPFPPNAMLETGCAERTRSQEKILTQLCIFGGGVNATLLFINMWLGGINRVYVNLGWVFSRWKRQTFDKYARLLTVILAPCRMLPCCWGCVATVVTAVVTAVVTIVSAVATVAAEKKELWLLNPFVSHYSRYRNHNGHYSGHYSSHYSHYTLQKRLAQEKRN